jgi:hypothetical protein
MEKANETKASPDTGTSAMAVAMKAVNPVAAEAWISCTSEIAQFLTERVKQDLDTQKAVMACKSPAELLKVQADFVTTAVDQYTGFSMRLYKAMTTATTNPFQGMRPLRARRYDDLPL